MTRIIIICITLIMQTNPLFGKNYYVYIDDNGNKVFTDRVPNKHNFKSFSQPQLNTIKWNSHKIAFNKKSNNTSKKRNASDDKKQYCQKLSRQVQLTERKLSRRLKPEDFEQLKKSLSHQRWMLRKRCR